MKCCRECEGTVLQGNNTCHALTCLESLKGLDSLDATLRDSLRMSAQVHKLGITTSLLRPERGERGLSGMRCTYRDSQLRP